MSTKVFKLECLTNLHVGSGDFNYGVVDKEVERDCLSGNPVIHASGVKGALRDLAVKKLAADKVKDIFGGEGDNNRSTTKGSYKFFDAHLLSRPLRVSGNHSFSYISVTTPEIINGFIDTLEAFGFENLPKRINENFSTCNFRSNVKNIYIEGDDNSCKAEMISDETKNTLDAILGGNYALVKTFEEFKLPVIARNNLDIQNLWYEEFVPHHSVFYMLIIDDGSFELDFADPVQLGGNSSVGYGYTKITEFEVKTNEQ